MVFEDLHWIDPTSLELLSLALDQFVPDLLEETSTPCASMTKAAWGA
jgi:predicted ATPase